MAIFDNINGALQKKVSKLNSDLTNKQNLMRQPTYKGNINVIGGNDLPSDDSFCWMRKSDITGTLPASFGDNYGTLFTYKIGTGTYLQKLVGYPSGNEYRRTYINSTWSSWGNSYTEDESNKLFQKIIKGAASTVADNDLTKDRVLVSDSSGKISVSSITSTALGYLSGLKDNIQTQIDNIINSLTVKTENLNKNWLNVNFIKYGNVKYARCSAYPNANMSAYTEYIIGTLSSEFRPTHDISYVTLVNQTDENQRDIKATINIKTTGEVTIYTTTYPIPTTVGINFYIAYI